MSIAAVDCRDLPLELFSISGMWGHSLTFVLNIMVELRFYKRPFFRPASCYTRFTSIRNLIPPHPANCEWVSREIIQVIVILYTWSLSWYFECPSYMTDRDREGMR